jgi:hypothetical protein
MKKMDKRKRESLQLAKDFCEQVMTRWENVSVQIMNIPGAWVVVGGVTKDAWFNPFYFSVPYRDENAWTDFSLRFGVRGARVYVLTNIANGMRHIDEGFRKSLRGKVVLLTAAQVAEQYPRELIRKLISK